MSRQWAMGAGSPRWRPIRIARSNATHVIKAEYVERRRPPRLSHTPSSGSCQCFSSQSSCRHSASHSS
jgi:hypothetical protein